MARRKKKSHGWDCCQSLLSALVETVGYMAHREQKRSNDMDCFEFADGSCQEQRGPHFVEWLAMLVSYVGEGEAALFSPSWDPNQLDLSFTNV